MSHRVRAAAVEDVPNDRGLELVLDGKIIALYRFEEMFYAMDGICPHAGGPLGQGVVDQGIVTCPWHGWQFDITSGQHCLTPQIQQTKYETEVENGDIFVIFPEA